MKRLSAVTQNPWLVIIIASLFPFYDFIQMNLFNVISPDLTQVFKANATQFGILASVYFYTTIFLLFPAGILLDRFSPKKIILLGMLFYILSTVLLAMAHSFLFAAIARCLAGMAGTCSFLSVFIIVARWCPTKRMSFGTGLVITIAMLGGIISQTPLYLYTNYFGWRFALWSDAILGLIIVGLISFFVRDQPAGQTIINDKSAARINSMPLWSGIRLAAANRQNWLCGIYTCLLNLPIVLLGAVWGIAYLNRVNHLNASQASYMTSMIFLGTLIGAPTVSWIADWFKERRVIMLIGGIGAILISGSILLGVAFNWLQLLILFFLLGVFTSTQVLTYPLVIESNSKELTGTAEGLTATLIMLGGVIFQPLFGYIMDYHDFHAKLLQHYDLASYSVGAYQMAFALLPLSFLAACLLIMGIREPRKSNTYFYGNDSH